MAQKATFFKKGTQQSSNKKPQDAKKRAASPAEKNARRKSRAEKEEPSTPRIIDDRARRDIAGIIFAVLAIALLLIIAVPSDALVTAFAAEALRLAFGVGAYLLPVLLLIIGVCFLARIGNERMPARAAIGLTIIFIAILGIIAALTPILPGDIDLTASLFERNQLIERGGYVGAGIAWVGLRLFGIAVTIVVLIGAIATGLVIVGFSISRFVEVIKEKRAERMAEQDKSEVLEADPYKWDYQTRGAGGFVPARIAGQDATKPLSRWRTKHGKAADSRGATRMRGAASFTDETPTARLQTDGSFDALSDTQVIAEDTPQKTPALTRKLGKTKTSSNAKKTASVPTQQEGSSDGFILPSYDLLKTSKGKRQSKAFSSDLAATASQLQKTLEDFGIMAVVVDYIAGPTVTLFEIDLPPGVRVSKITALTDDIALALAAPGVRIFAPIPKTHYVGIEVPNTTRENVLLGDVLKDAHGGPLQLAIGKDVKGNSIIGNLAKMPHLLIGGTTGSGKSVAINSMIMSMLMRATPAQVRFIMIDPKRVEFTPYNGIPHLYVPVVIEPKEAASALAWGVAEMERRLKVLSKAGARNISQYNNKVSKGLLEDEQAEKLPYIVIIIDELSDLMMNVGKEIEFSISRIAQLARAAGIHLIVATQRPSANVVTGLIKANITTRMAFNVATGIDSRVILDTAGAESLIGNGDLLFSKPEYPEPLRIQGCYVSPEEISAVVEAVKSQAEPEYHHDILQTNLITLGASQPDGSGGSSDEDDPLMWDAAEIVVSSGMGSTSNIQRKLKVGYSRAGRIMDMLESKGIVGPPNGSKPREVLIDVLELESLKAFEQNDVKEE